MDIIKDVIQKEFVDRGYLIPTDNIRQQSDRILNNYIAAMRSGKPVSHIWVCTKDQSRIGQEVPVSDLASYHEEIYLVDGHHRYIAWLANPKYPLYAKFIQYEPDIRGLSDYCAFADGYDWAITLRQE